MKLNIYALFKALSCLGLLLFASRYQEISALYQDFSFDNLFPVTLYKNALDESMALCGDLQVLHENTVDQCLCIDATVGRIVRLIGCLGELSAYQQKTNAHLQEDGAYLLMVFEQIHKDYQAIEQTKQYTCIAPLFEQTRQKLIHAFEL